MSLLDGLLRDALLQNVVQSDVYIAIRTDNSGNATPIGSGTVDDPYGGPNDSGDWFDYTMSHYVAASKTVRIGPGVFRTKGGTGNGSHAWVALSGMRILGAGVAETTLKLVGTDNEQRYAIAMPASSTGLTGFEVSDLTIDSGYASAAGTGRVQGAINVFGTHVLLKRIRAINFGGSLTGTMKVFNIGPVWTATGNENIEDCVLDSVTLESPGSLSGTCALIWFGGTTANPHRFCVVRNCYARTVNAANPAIFPGMYGIVPGAGVGTVLEGNEISNLEIGIFDPNGAECGKDLVIRNNYVYSVSKGISFNRSSGTIERIIATGNLINLGTTAALAAPCGINLTGSTATRYTTLILRKNVIRDLNNPEGITTGLYGVNASYARDLNVESNIINNAATDKAVVYANCTAAKTFNNQTSGGALLRGYNGTGYVLELEDAVQDVLLPM